MTESIFDNSRVLVAGGTGFIGTNLIKRLLLTSNCDIISTVHRRDPQIIHDRLKYISCDLTNKQDCDLITENIDYVFMCAANTSGAAVIEKSPLSHVSPNILMNTLLLESSYLSHVKKFLFISSSTVYPVSDEFLSEEDTGGILFEKYFCVGWMKKFSEILCEMYASKINPPMQTIIIRPGNVYGEFDDFEWETSHVLPSLIRKVVEKRNPIEVWGNGQDIKDFIYIRDFIDGLILSMQKIDYFDIINIASGKSHTIRESLNIILAIENYDNASIIFDESKPTMIPIRRIDISKAKRLLGFNPKFSLYEGLYNTVKWYHK